MTASSWPISASTFWKKTIQGAILCVQPTCFDSSSCSRKLPAVWKNFFGTIGGRSLAPSSGTRSPVSAAPPRSNHSRIVGTSSTTISSPSTRPTRPSSKVTRRAMRPPPRRSDRAGRPGRRPSQPGPARGRASPACRASTPSNSKVGSPRAAPSRQLGVGDHGIQQPEPLRDLDLVLQCLRGEPGDADPSARSSSAWSRNPHDCGVQPRAPGIASQLSGHGRSGRPVRG